MTLYLKYRSKNLDELDLTDVRESLKKIMSSKDIPHAFLFAGPKGTGKTSAARILAKIINCDSKNPPCDKCEQCLSITNGSNLDVIEMDAASHRGIDDVRTLRDAVKLAPINSKKKIYIIDEAHMLTTEASNALLKTLEEPPPHVVFILATTNPEKLIDTIKSRVTYIAFNKATPDEVERCLKRVIAGEKIKIDEETLKNITKSANGSFRDAVKILEQFSLEGNKFINSNFSQIDEFVDLLYKKDANKLLESVKKNVESGVSVDNFIKEILSKIQKDLLEDVSNKKDLIELMELLIEANKNITDSPIEELPLEIAIIKWSGEEIKNDPEPILGDKVDDNVWKRVLSQVKPINASVEALLRSAKPLTYDGKTLTLGVFYKFHKERLEDSKHRKILEGVIGQVLNSPTRIVCTMCEPPPIAPLTEGKDQDIVQIAEKLFSN